MRPATRCEAAQIWTNRSYGALLVGIRYLDHWGRPESSLFHHTADTADREALAVQLRAETEPLGEPSLDHRSLCTWSLSHPS